MNPLISRLRANQAALRLAAQLGLALATILLLLKWGGVAQPGPLLAVGVAVFLGMISAMALLAWWLYRSPMPGVAPAPVARSASLYQLLVLLVMVSSVLSLMGAVWDAQWHQRYGSFGDDFLWPPHILLYASFGLVALFAGLGMLSLIRGASDLRRQFRADPLVGLIGLTACYMVMGIPSDQLWHALYGQDLTAWSLPHVMLALCYSLIILAAIAMQLGLIAPQPWRGLGRLQASELAVAALAGMSLCQLLLLGVIEWEGIITIGANAGTAFGRAFWERPEWLFPVVVLAVGLFSGSLALHTLRRAGAATLAGLVALALRASIMVALRTGAALATVPLLTHLIVLVPLLTLDLWYARHLASAPAVQTQLRAALLAGGVFMAVALPAIAAVMIYPRVSWRTAPPMVIVGLAAGVFASWLGANAGAWLAAVQRPAQPRKAPRWVRGVALATLLLVGSAATFYMLLAPPPL